MSEESEKGSPQEVDPLPKEKRKVSHSETGHAINVANFEDLESICIGFGSLYNPTKAGISLTAIAAKRLAAVGILKSFDDLTPVLIAAINAREIAFAPLSPLVRRINYAVEVSDVTKEFINDVKTLTRKLLGIRSTPKHQVAVENPLSPESKIIKNYSSSQMSMDNRIENLYKLIQLLASEPNYKPNEDDLTVASLTVLHEKLRTSNTAVINANTPIVNMRIERNVILYHPLTGLVRMAADVKIYVKSVFGFSSPQYKEINRLKFKAGSDLANKVK